MYEREAFPYTVLLLKPQPIAAPYGKDIVLYHVAEDSADEAIVEAQHQAFEAHEAENQDQDPADWHVLAVFEGHHDNMAPPPEPGYLVKITPDDHAFLFSTLGQIDVQTSSAAKSAMVARISRKLSRTQIQDEVVSILFSASEHRVLLDLLWEIKKVVDDKGTAEKADLLWGKVINSFHEIPD